MSILPESGDRISPSLFDVRAMIAIGSWELSGYQVSRQIEDDIRDGVAASNGKTQSSLKRLCMAGLVSKLGNGHFTLTRLGRQILAIELSKLNALLRIAEDRI